MLAQILLSCFSPSCNTNYCSEHSPTSLPNTGQKCEAYFVYFDQGPCSSVGNMSCMVPYLLFLCRPPSSSTIVMFIFSFVFLIALAIICLSAEENTVVRSCNFCHLLTQPGGSWDIHSRIYIPRMVLSICWTWYFPFSFCSPHPLLPFLSYIFLQKLK